MSYQSTVVADGATFYWRLNESSTGVGATAADTKAANAGTYQGTCTGGQTGPAGTGDTGVLFNGSTGYVQTTNPISIPANTFSLEAWFKTSTAGANIIGLVDAQGTSGNGYIHMYVGTDGKLWGGIYTGSADVVTSAATVSDGNWHHGLLVCEASTNQMHLYTDGVQSSGSNSAATNAGVYVHVGWDSNSGWAFATGTFGNVTVEQVAWYGTTALTQANATDHYNQGSAAAGPQTIDLTGHAIAHTRAQGALKVNPKLAPAGQAHTRAQGALTVSPQLKPAGQTHARALGNPTIPGATVRHIGDGLVVTVAWIPRPTALTRTRRQGNPVAHGRTIISTPALAHARAQGNPTLSARVTPAGQAHARAQGAPEINLVTLHPLALARA